ncbi:HDL286Cp [Eremothecium sinecaudum]|uniref:HDL286Cp n=1 Tax=Eremothecium sinecaudum TaxID=45286 RepID=A0A109UYV9_9SACH|nr:HDL286Cp [Eremothecium sinecaudum]AMD20458.1 HDL286Cp [Eremothecium sinecaudum]
MSITEEGLREDLQNGEAKYGTYIAINEYSKRMEDELDMKPGDKIEVITDDGEYNDGWYYGRNLSTGEEGLYPKLFTQEISIARPSAMRNKSNKRISNATGNDSTENLTKGISVKTTMSDIDRVLEELRGESLNDVNVSFAQGSSSGNTTLTNYERGSLSSHGQEVNQAEESKDEALNPGDALSWSPEQVAKYMRSVGFEDKYASKFEEHEVTGAILLELELAHLKELDITSFGTRFELHKRIEAIKEQVSNKNSNLAQRGDAGNAFGGYNKSPKLLDAAPLKHIQETRRVEVTSDKEENLMPVQEKPIPALPLKLNTTPSQLWNRRSATLRLDEPGRLREASDVVPQMRSFANTPRLRSSMIVPLEDGAVDDTFLSPRRAPIPPSYPSPVQPPKSPAFNRSTFSPSSPLGRISPFQKNGSSSNENVLKTVQSPSSLGNSFGKRIQGTQNEGANIDNMDTTELPNPYASSLQSETKMETIGSSAPPVILRKHKKSKSSGSFVELFNRISLLSSPTDDAVETFDNSEVPSSDRPTSSIYAHSANASGTQSRPSITVTTDPQTKHRRNSSIPAFISREKDQFPPSQDALLSTPQMSRRGSLSDLKLGVFDNNYSADSTRSFKKASTADVTSDVYEVEKVPTEDESSKSKERLTTFNMKSSEEQRRSVSAKEQRVPVNKYFDAREELTSKTSLSTERSGTKDSKRSLSDAVKSMKRLNGGKSLSKKQTSAFTGGIRNVSVDDSIKDADCSGWMSKKGAGTMGVWKNRFFTLHGTRLSYFSNISDTRERGLIDITSHRVLPAKEDDKFVALYAASVGKGRYCFKLVPPAPGSRKGLTFTQPKIHYFAVESKEEMRTWMAALMKATIDVDTTVPVISSCATPTVSLSRAQELFSQALEKTYKRDESMLNQEDSEEMYWEQNRRLEAEDTLNGSSSFSSSQNRRSLSNTNVGVNDNKINYSSTMPSYMDMDSPTASASTATGKNSQQFRFSFEQPTSALNNVGGYLGLDPKFLGDRI